MRIRSALLLLSAAASLAGAGCGDSTGPKALNFTGRYPLVSVDGATLPLVLYDDPTLKLTLTEGALTLNANATFTEDVRIDVVANGFPSAPELLSCGGSYERNGNSFTLTGTATENCDASTATGTLSGRTLTVDDQGQILVFQR